MWPLRCDERARSSMETSKPAAGLRFLMLIFLAMAALAAQAPIEEVPWSRVRTLDQGLVREVRVWRSGPGEAVVQVLRDGTEVDRDVVEMDVPRTPGQLILRDTDLQALECIRAISPGWRASRVVTWARRPDALLTDEALENALPGWRGGTAMIWYFDDLLVIARVEDGIITELHEVFEAGTVELRQDAHHARSELDRSLQRIQSRRDSQ